MALLAGELVANRLRARPGLRLILPTGHTPLGMYEALRAHAADGSLATGRATLFQLDEYAGLGAGRRAELRRIPARELRGIRFAAVHGLDGSAPDREAECARHQALLDAAPLDLVVLGLGRDGHVAFDEPGSDLATGTRRVRLRARPRGRTRPATSARWRPCPREALTVGLRTLARRARAAHARHRGGEGAARCGPMLEGVPGPDSPASLLRDHPRLTVVCDTAAASSSARRPAGRATAPLIVLGHREPERERRARDLRRVAARLRLAVSECRATRRGR